MSWWSLSLRMMSRRGCVWVAAAVLSFAPFPFFLGIYSFCGMTNVMYRRPLHSIILHVYYYYLWLCMQEIRLSSCLLTLSLVLFSLSVCPGCPWHLTRNQDLQWTRKTFEKNIYIVGHEHCKIFQVTFIYVERIFRQGFKLGIRSKSY